MFSLWFSELLSHSSLNHNESIVVSHMKMPAAQDSASSLFCRFWIFIRFFYKFTLNFCKYVFSISESLKYCVWKYENPKSVRVQLSLHLKLSKVKSKLGLRGVTFSFGREVPYKFWCQWVVKVVMICPALWTTMKEGKCKCLSAEDSNVIVKVIHLHFCPLKVATWQWIALI